MKFTDFLKELDMFLIEKNVPDHLRLATLSQFVIYHKENKVLDGLLKDLFL